MSNDPKHTSVDLAKLTKERVNNKTPIHKPTEKLITVCKENLELIGHTVYYQINLNKDNTIDKND